MAEPPAGGRASPAARRLERHLPLLPALRASDAAGRRADLIAGIVSWGVMVPVALAYAGLAGLAPEAGLVTAVVALTAYAVFATSRHVKVTTSSAMAIMSASVVGAIAAGRGATIYAELTAALALIVGAVLLVAGLLRLGFVSQFLAKPVVSGFVVGLAVVITVGQLPKLFGVKGASGNVFEQVAGLVQALPATNWWTLGVSVAAFALMILLRALVPKAPAALVVLALGIAASYLLHLADHGVAVVGEIKTGFPLPGLPAISPGDLPALTAGALAVVFLAVAESLGASRSFAARHGYEILPDQELIAIGAANLSSGFFGGFAVDASLSQSATAESAGARTQLSSLVTAALILATALVLAPLFSLLPQAVLAVIVIASVAGLVDVPELRRYLRWRPTDFALALAATVGVVTTSAETGMFVAVVLSLAVVIFNSSRPGLAGIGRIPGPLPRYGDIERHPDAEPVPGVRIFRLDTPLYFVNADLARERLLAALGPEAEAVVVFDLSASADFDVAALDALAELHTRLERRSIRLRLASVRGPARDRLRRSGVMEVIGAENVYLSVAEAVAGRAEGTAGATPAGDLDSGQTGSGARAGRRAEQPASD